MTVRPELLDGDGYLIDDSHTLSIGSVFTRRWLEQSLWAYGEDAVLVTVREGLDRATVEAIGTRYEELEYQPDPASRTGRGYPGDKALALAAVEVVEGSARPLSRKRRRPTA